MLFVKQTLREDSREKNCKKTKRVSSKDRREVFERSIESGEWQLLTEKEEQESLSR